MSGNSLTAADVKDIKIVSQAQIVQVLGLDVMPGGRGYKKGPKKCKKSTSP